MQTSPDPYSITTSTPPKNAEDYNHEYELLKKEQDDASKAPPDLPYQISSFPQYLGNMITMCDEMIELLQTASTEDSFKTKIISAQLEKLGKLKEDIIDLNFSIYDLKL